MSNVIEFPNIRKSLRSAEFSVENVCQRARHIARSCAGLPAAIPAKIVRNPAARAAVLELEKAGWIVRNVPTGGIVFIHPDMPERTFGFSEALHLQRDIAYQPEQA